MKKILCCLMALTLLLPVLAYGETADASLQAVLDKGTLVVGVDAMLPPMSFVQKTDEGEEYIGFDVELAYAVCDILGVTLEIQPISWGTVDVALADGQIDCIWSGFAITPDREDMYAFSIPYMRNEQVFVVRTDAPYQSPKDLLEVVIGVQEASAVDELLRADADFMGQGHVKSISTFESALGALGALGEGAVDVALVDMAVAAFYMAAGETVDYRVLEESFADEQFAVGFRQGEETLREAVNQALIDLAFNGVMEEISTDWFTDNITIVAEIVAMAEEE